MGNRSLEDKNRVTCSCSRTCRPNVANDGPRHVPANGAVIAGHIHKPGMWDQEWGKGHVIRDTQECEPIHGDAP